MDSGIAVRRPKPEDERSGFEPARRSGWGPDPGQGSRFALILATVVAAIAVTWLVLVFLVEPVRFVMFDPEAKTGFEVFLAIGQVFGAFVLAMSPIRPAYERLRWVAAGFLVFGIGTIGYGYVYPLLVDSPGLVASLNGSIYVRAVGTALCAIGLAASRLPRISRWAHGILAATIVAAGILLVPLSDTLPAPIRAPGSGTGSPPETASVDSGGQEVLLLTDLEVMLATAGAVFPGLTAWYVALAMIPLAASVIAAWSATRRASAEGGIGLWLVLALALLAGAQLHSVFWPSVYSSVLSTTSLLRLAMAVAVVVGGIVELGTIVRQRDALLIAEQERARRLEDLAQLKADFTSIVAHELANPVAAIRAMAQVLALDDVPAGVRRRTAAEIEGEARVLEMLVDDIRETASVERDDFRIDSRPIAMDRLVSEAAAYARRLPGAHPVTVEENAAEATVRGDPGRLGQVMRNLLDNAARYTPDGTQITISTRRERGEVVIAVADRGPGIPPEDLGHIFEKFGRGRDAARNHAGGRGLGLYLSRRIVRSHGSDLVVESAPGQGTSFRFGLKEVP